MAHSTPNYCAAGDYQNAVEDPSLAAVRAEEIVMLEPDSIRASQSERVDAAILEVQHPALPAGTIQEGDAAVELNVVAQGRDDASVRFLNPQLQLAAIYDSERHKFMFKEWKREFLFLEKEYDQKLESYRRSTVDLFTILGLNFTFQGLLVSGIAPSQIVVCRHRPTVWVLSSITSLGAFLAMAQKLVEAKENYQRVRLQEKHMKWQKARIYELKRRGRSYAFDEVQPFNPRISEEPYALTFISVIWVWSHSSLILGLLLAFSIAILVCIQRLLCN